MKVRIREGSWMARLAAGKLKTEQVAMVIGQTIYLHNTTREEFLSDTQWVCHELTHVQQYREHGVAGFLAKYVVDWLKNGYYQNRFEVQARAGESDLGLLENVRFI